MHIIIECLINALGSIEWDKNNQKFLGYADSDLKNIERIINLYENLDDEFSKIIFCRVIVWRILHKFTSHEIISSNYPLFNNDIFSAMLKEAQLMNVKDKNFSTIDKMVTFIVKEYEYNDCIAEDGDIVLNCGAYNGSSSIYFSELVGDKGAVYSFEPLVKNYIKLSDNIMNYNNIIPLNYGISNEDGIAYFKFGEAGSHISDDGEKVIIRSIDSFVKGTNLKRVDFIKMDIEGNEYKALQGAKETILKYSPKMALCIYHYPHHIYTIFEFIKNLNVNYKYYLLHATDTIYDTILFCMPSKNVDDSPAYKNLYKLNNTEKNLLKLISHIG